MVKLLNLFAGNTSVALLMTFLFITIVVAFCFKMLLLFRSPYINVLAVKANKYKLVFLVISFNAVLHSIIRQLFPNIYDLKDILTAVGMILSVFFICVIFYYSEEVSKNEHEDNFQAFKKKRISK